MREPAPGGPADTGWFASRAFIVTGATAGIGLAIARELAARGATVGVGSRTHDRAEAAAAAIERAVPLSCPPDDPDGPAKMITSFIACTGRLDGLVNNAGTSLIESASTLTRDRFRATFDANVTQTFLTAQAAAAAMTAGGAIVNLSSISAERGSPGRAAYAASKAAVDALTRVLAVEWAPAIRVNGIAPGHVETETLRHHVELGTVDPERMRARTPLGRIGNVDEIARVARFLLGPDAAYISGETVAVDGGWLAFAAA